MVCGRCVDKVATRLVRNHNIDWLFARERASKGLERAESVSRAEEQALGFDPDYSQSCNATGSCRCYSASQQCIDDADCYFASSCGCACPDPLPNSHYVSDTCSGYKSGCECWWNAYYHEFRCVDFGCACGCPGSCYYDCDEGYEWDGEACVAVAVKKIVGDGLSCVVS